MTKPTGIETRNLLGPLKILAAKGTGRTVFGYAAVFNSRSQNLGGQSQFYEIIKPGAFDGVLQDDVRALYNHQSDQILARTKSGTLKIGVDQTGLWYEFEAPDTQAGNDLLTSIKRGDIDQSSFSFRVAKGGDSIARTKDADGTETITRTITKFSELLDVSPTTYPAYLDTEVDCRSIIDAARKPGTSTPEPTPERNNWKTLFSILR